MAVPYTFTSGTLISAAQVNENFGAVVSSAALATSTGSSEVGFIQSGSGAVARTAQGKMRDVVSAKDFGAVGDGVTNDRNALAAADTQGSFTLTPGNYKIESNLTITNGVTFLPGSRLVIPNGVTVTFSGPLSAGVFQIFSCTGTGAVVLNHRYTPRGYPEWWGAKADLSVDCLSAFHAARDALLVVECQGGDYLITDTLKWNKQHRALVGVGCMYTDTDAEVTRIFTTNGSTSIIQIGPDTQPAVINSFYQGVSVKKVYFSRSVAPVIASNCAGVLSRWVLYGVLEDVKVADSMVGFRENGVVYFTKERCSAVRAQAGSGAGTDYFVGHYADGSGSIGASGGNASLYYYQCSAGCNYAPLQSASGSIGFKADGAFSDLFYRDPETVGFYYGQAVLGDGSSGLTFGNVDCLIDHPIHDQFHYAGIYVTDVAASGAIEIENPYFGPAADARVCLYLNSLEGGSTVVRGGQFVMGAAPNTQAMLVDSSNNCHILDFPTVVEHGSAYPMLSSTSSGCILTINATNPTVSAGACVQLSGTISGSIVEPRISGGASKVQYGIQVVGSGDSNSEYRVTGIQSSCLPAADRKLNRNSVAVTSVGLTGTNYAVGVFT